MNHRPNMIGVRTAAAADKARLTIASLETASTLDNRPQPNATGEQNMFKSNVTILTSMIALAFLASEATATTLRHTCVGNSTLQQKIDNARTGDTILVEGTCTENVVISTDGLTICCHPWAGRSMHRPR